MENRADRLSPGRSNADYSNELHHVLAAGNVEHKVVTYQYRYITRLREEAVGTGTAVIYRDGTTPGYPWWIMDSRLTTPVWLPNEPVNRQLRFYLRRDAEVLAQQDYSGSDSSKSLTTAPAVAARSSQPKPTVQFAQARKPALIRSVFPSTQTARVKMPPAQAIARVKPKLTPAVARVKPPQPVALIARVKPQPTPARVANNAPRKQGHSLQSARPVRVTFSRRAIAPRAVVGNAPEKRVNEIFRASHGTAYNPASGIDRRKMAALRQTLLRRAPRISMRTF